MIDEKVLEVMNSRALGMIAHFAQDVVHDVNNKAVLRSVLSTCVIDLAGAIDHDRIHFDNIEDEALFMGLLACCLQQIFDGKAIKVDEMTVQ